MRRIFVVEDESVVALEIMDHVRTMGHEVCGHAARGTTALQKIAEVRPDLIIMDINLGAGLSGLDVAEQLTGIIDVPVIFLTAHSDRELTERAGRGDSFAYLSKPFSPLVLRANIDLAFVRRDAMRALQKSEARTRILFEQAAVGIGEIDSHSGRFLQVNRMLCDIAGYSPEEMSALTFMGISHPDDLALDRTLIKRIKRGEPFGSGLEKRVIRKDGTTIWVAVTLSPLSELDGLTVRHVVFVQDISERKRAEDALVASESRYRRLFEGAIEGIFHVDRDGTIISVNPAFARIVGYDSPTELVGRNQSQFFRDARMPLRIQELFRDVDVLNGFDVEWRTKSGERLDVEIFGRAVRDESGHAIGYHGLVHDVSERRQHETALRMLSTGLAQLDGAAFFEMISSQVATVLDADVGFVGVCQPGPHSRILTIGLFADGRTHPAIEYDVTGAPCESVVSGHTEVFPSGVQGLFPKDSKLKTFAAESYAATPLVDSGGRVMGHVGVFARESMRNPERVRSVLQLFALRAAAELERQRAAARFVSVFEFAPDALLIVDAAGHILSANRMATEMFGYERDELRRLTVEDLVPREDRHAHASNRRGFASQRSPRRMGTDRSQLRALRRDGTTLSVEISLSPFQSHEGSLVVAAIRDTTVRVALEKWVNQRERLDALGTLAGGIAHDLNNALGPILMATDVLRSEYPNAPDILETIERSTKRAAGMVRQILNFAKGSTGERASVSMHHLVGEMQKIIRATYPKDVRVEVVSDRAVPAVLGDATQLHQVLLNLCVNARDAMPQGGHLRIELRLASCEEVANGQRHESGAKTGAFVLLRVHDTGTGIPHNVVDRIFDPFFTTKGPDKGTGLGLSTSSRIVRSHGGFINVDSTPSLGSVFSVFLPAGPTEASDPSPSVSVTAFSGNGQHVLYVDDDAALRDAAMRLLAGLNFTPIAAGDGTDGLLQLAQHSVEIRAVITDLNMPHMSGVAFIREVRRLSPTMPIIVTSGLIDDTSLAELHELGVSHLLYKPFTKDELAIQLRDVFAAGAPAT